MSAVVGDTRPRPAGAGQPPEPLLPLEHSARVRAWVHRVTGLRFPDSKRYFVDKRVQACVQQHGGDFEAWFGALRRGADPRVAEELVNQLTVNETYFLREDHQFDALLERVLPALVAQRRADRDASPLRLVSLPCATGEEPYSLALRLLEDWPDLATVDVQVLAGDIDTRVLAAARCGEYGERSLQRVPPAVRSRWFERLPDGRHRVAAALRDAVELVHVNLCEEATAAPLRRADVVFCRNVLIYFDQESCDRAAQTLHGLLRPGGWLFLGHSESLARRADLFSPVRLPETVAYRRVDRP